MKIKILFLILLSDLCFSQVKFESGYYKDNNRNVVNCLIKNKDWYENPTFIEIKNSENDVVVIKTTAEISEFKVDGYPKYIRATVDVDDFIDNYSYFNNIPEPAISQKTILLKTENEGDAILYSYINEKFIKYYFSKANEPIKLLIFKKYFNENNQIVQNNFFKQQLSSNLILTEELQRKLTKTSYSIDDLNNFFNIVNKKQSEKTALKPKEKRKIFNINLKAGVVFNSYESLLNQNRRYYFSFPAETNYGFGLEIEHVLNFNKNKWSIYFEPFYESFSSSTVGPQFGALTKSAEISIKVLNLAAGVKHNMFVNNNSCFFISAAVQITSIISNPNFLINNQVFKINENNIGFNGCFGYKYKKFILEYRLRAAQNLADDSTGFQTNYASSALILGYTIF